MEATPHPEPESATAGIDWSVARQSAERMIALEAAPSPQIFLRLAQACWHLKDTDAAFRAATDALVGDPTLTEAVIICAWVAAERGDVETVLSHYRTLARLNPDKVRWQLQIIMLLNRLGRVTEVIREIELARVRWPTHPMVKSVALNFGHHGRRDWQTAPSVVLPRRETGAQGDPAYLEEEALRVLVAKAPRDGELMRQLMVDDPERDVIVAEAGGATTAVLVFTGTNDGMSFPLVILDRYLAAMGVTAVYIKDFHRLRFLMGVRSLGEDYRGTLTALQGLVDRFGVARLCTMGNCEGGFAAIRYGAELGADRILAFAAPTHSPPESFTRLEGYRYMLRSRLRANVAEEWLDLKPFLEAGKYRLKIHLFYEEAVTRDRLHALHLADVPGVRLHPQPVSPDSRVLRQLASSDGFGELLGRTLGLESE